VGLILNDSGVEDSSWSAEAQMVYTSSGNRIPDTNSPEDLGIMGSLPTNSSEAIARVLLIVASADQVISSKEISVLMRNQNLVESAGGLASSNQGDFQRYADSLGQDCARYGCDPSRHPIPNELVVEALKAIQGEFQPLVYGAIRSLAGSDGLDDDEAALLRRIAGAWNV
jgi:hypothetical protein